MRSAALILVLVGVASGAAGEDWKPVPGHIMTRWAKDVSPDRVLPEYPRPQIVRPQWQNLNGLWDYAVTDLAAAQPEKYDGKILVPFCIESALSGVKRPLTDKQRLWYRRTFSTPALKNGQRMLLHFGAVDWDTKVLLNGKPVGQHTGGFDPFTFDISDTVKPEAANELIVSVFDATGGMQPRGKQKIDAIANPKGIRYTPCSGIWQTVWLEIVPANYVQSLKIVPDVDAGSVAVTVAAPAAGKVKLTALEGDRVVATAEGAAGQAVILKIPQAKLWSPESPFLYDLRVECGDDRVTSYFGMRKIALGKNDKGVTRIMLNGKVVFQAGFLDQGYWPDGIYTAPTDDALRYDIEMTKKLGMNMARKHVKVEPARWYYWCDKLGLLVWQDMPSGNAGQGAGRDKQTRELHDGKAVSPEANAQFEKELRAMVEGYWNHPSIVMWVVFNEGWGQYDTPRLTRLVKELDPSRLVNNASGGHDVAAGDVMDAHLYPGPFCPKPTDGRAAVLGEFGGLGLPTPGHTWVAKNWGYRGVSNPEELTKRYCELIRAAYELRDTEGLNALVYTQTTDVETECNGLLTYDREVVKGNIEEFAAANRGLAQPADWKHSGSLVLLTTPDGADLPATAVEKDFPVLVRLRKQTFDFRQAKPNGEDIRFADAAGQMLPYQIDHWDAAAGVADIWVRVPVIRGNQRQAIQLRWGNPAAASHSNGDAVFNESNGYAVVMHLGGAENPVKDVVGTVAPVDAGTSSCGGVVGAARRFEPGKGIACGEKIAGLPTGLGPNSTEAWIKADRVNTIAVGWGNEQGQGKVTMAVHSPPHIRMECYFSSADVRGESRLPMSEWVHVVHSYQQGDSRVYLNGRQDGVTKSGGAFLNIRNPARMWLGGWYKNYRFEGDIDEVRISKVARSADWVKLAYENQKPLQSLVGTLPQLGAELSVSPSEITIDEGKSMTFTAKAGKAEKVSWLLSRGGRDTVVAVDQFSYTLEAGRVESETPCVLKFKAVYPKEVKTLDARVVISNSIPEPAFTLKAPAKWNGRDTIEIVPVIGNREAMQERGAGALQCKWTVTGGAVIQKVAPDKLILKRSQFSGPLTVTAAIDNGGKPTVVSARIEVTEPKSDPWVVRTPEKNEQPEENQFYARDDKNEGTLYYNGFLDQPADSVFLKLYADEKLVKTESQKLAADRIYAFTVKLKPGLIKYRVEFGSKTGNEEKVLRSVGNLVCGDAILIQGQSNALATDTHQEAPRETNEWIRSYRGPTGRQDGSQWIEHHLKRTGGERPNLWCNPVWKARPKDPAELGYWGMELAKRLLTSQKMPICIITGAVGGTRIDEHQPTLDNHGDLSTIYGRTLWRVQQARLTHGIRAVLWHQGESDQGSDGPTGGYGWETYQQYFITMSAAWKEDFPNVQHYYVFQIWPNACAMGGRHGSGDRLREAQRTLPQLYSNMHIMSTLGIRPPGGCHYPLAGWGEFARLIQPLIERDLYGATPTASITPPDLRKVYFTTPSRDEIAIQFDQPLALWHEGMQRQFYLDGAAGEVAGGQIAGETVTLRLKKPSDAKKITYLKEADWQQENLVVGANGIAALTFADVEIGKR